MTKTFFFAKGKYCEKIETYSLGMSYLYVTYVLWLTTSEKL